MKNRYIKHTHNFDYDIVKFIDRAHNKRRRPSGGTVSRFIFDIQIRAECTEQRRFSFKGVGFGKRLLRRYHN